jgi:hypothetical protein
MVQIGCNGDTTLLVELSLTVEFRLYEVVGMLGKRRRFGLVCLTMVENQEMLAFGVGSAFLIPLVSWPSCLDDLARFDLPDVQEHPKTCWAWWVGPNVEGTTLMLDLVVIEDQLKLASDHGDVAAKLIEQAEDVDSGGYSNTLKQHK